MEKIVIFDVDSTLIDKEYQLTLPVKIVKEKFSIFQAQGNVVGLCSDTPLPLMQKWAKNWGIKGPLFSEKGMFIFDKSKMVLPDQKVLDFFECAYSEIIKTLLRKNEVVQGEKLLVFGNVNLFARDIFKNQIKFDQNITSIVLLNQMRKASFSCFIRRKIGGNWTFDEMQLREIKSIFSKNLQYFDTPLHFDLNMDYGILIVHLASSSKKQIVPYLCKKYTGYEKIMIGDSMPDFLDSDFVRQFGVVNGDSEYLKKCERVSTLPLTEGCFELLEI